MAELKRVKAQNPETGVYEEFDCFVDSVARSDVDALKNGVITLKDATILHDGKGRIEITTGGASDE